MSGGADDADDRALPRWGLGLLWQSLPLILGLAAFELTANSMLGIAVACMKFGWEDFLTAVWLLRFDHQRMRSIACAGFQAALGFVKACVAGLVMVLAVLILAKSVRGAKQVASLEGQVVAAMLTIVGGGAAFAFMMAMGITSALFGRVQVWVGPESNRARRSQGWPPQSVQPSHRVANSAAALLAGASLLSGFAVWFSTLIVFGACDLLSRPVFILPLLALSLVGSFWIVFRLSLRIGSCVIAPTPLHCWPEASYTG